jgi:hypothetical protein
MATLAGALTLADWAKRVEAENQSRVAAIVELLALTNPIVEDMPFVEGNLPTGHKTTVRTGLPTATWRLLNYGVPISKSTTAQVVDTIGLLQAESQIDEDLARLNGNTASFRLTESIAFIESMTQTMASTIFYGNVLTNPERFMGLAPRYNSTNGASSSANVIDAGGTGSDNTSIWIVTWGANTTHGIFPKGMPTGLEHRDMGLQRVLDANSNPYWAYVDNYKWNMGLTVRDWRYNVRIANIDVSDLSTTSAANIINLLVRAVHRLPTTSGAAAPVTTQGTAGMRNSGMMGQTVIYANRVLGTYLHLQAMNKTNVQLSLGEWGGRPITMFGGIPIRMTDAILSTEARIT